MNNRRKFRYIKIKDDEPKKKTPAVRKNKSKTMKNIGNALTVVGTTISAIMLIFVIMMCIVVTVITVYILDFADNGYDLNLRDAENKFNTMVYAYDEDGNEVELKRISSGEYRIWVDYEDISPNLIHAVIATEDKRFYEHQGVDWRRTVFSLGADVFNLSRAGEGGSTVTQQLIKNLTGDDERSWERKLREIFRALSLEKKYTKTDILESYLNNIGLGDRYVGVEAASQRYFGKSAKDLDIAESAILASMIKNPSKRDPYINLENCKEHQLDTLYYMYEQGYINTDEYEAAQKEQVKFVGVVSGNAFGYTDPRSLSNNNTPDEEEDPDDTPHEAYKWNDYEISQDWYVDAAIDQVYEDYAELRGITYTSARNEISNGGYKIYINENMKLQKILEEKFKDPLLVQYNYDPDAEDDKLLQSAFIIMDYTGTVQALVGGLGDKPGDNCWNRATMSVRAPGSTMKPISAYSMGIQNNLITYSTKIPDQGIMMFNEDKNEDEEWPIDFEKYNTYKLMPAWEAVRKSTNTVAVRVGRLVTIPVMFSQLQSNLEISTLDPVNDMALSPMPLGALTNGIKLVELAAAYQMFGNGGTYYEPMLYSKVVDSKNNVVLEQNFYGNQAIDSDTAWVTNRMLRTVVNAPTGSPTLAKLDNVEVIGKTGTSNDGKNLMFVGMTPTHIGTVWLGIDDGSEIPNQNIGNKYVAQIWHDVMVDIVDTSENQSFTADSSVVELQYCTETGLLASTGCENTDTGYYRAGNLPDFCSGNHEFEVAKIWHLWKAIDDNDGTIPEDYVPPASMDDIDEDDIKPLGTPVG